MVASASLPALSNPSRRQVLVQRAAPDAAQCQRNNPCAGSAGLFTVYDALARDMSEALRHSVACWDVSASSRSNSRRWWKLLDNGAWGSHERRKVSSGPEAVEPEEAESGIHQRDMVVSSSPLMYSSTAACASHLHVNHARRVHLRVACLAAYAVRIGDMDIA